MASTKPVTKGYVKTENMVLIAFLTLAVGFLGGVAFGVYKSGPIPGEQAAAEQTAAPQGPDRSQEIAAMVQATRENPKDKVAWTELGHLYFDTGQPAKAIEAYETSLALDAKRPDVWTDLGVMYRRSGQAKKAVEAFDRALGINGQHQIALFNKGVVLMHDLNDAPGALKSWETLVRVNPEAKAPTGQPVKQLTEELRKSITAAGKSS